MTTVTLRRAIADDAPLVHSWRTEPSASRFQPMLTRTVDDLRSMLAERAATPIGNAPGTVQWIVEADSEPVGWIRLTVSEENHLHGNATIGYTVGERFRGRGYGSAGLAALLPLAFARDGFDLERLEAIAAVANTASRRVLEGNGFRLEGVLRGLLVIAGERVDHAIYGLLRSDWEGS